MSVIPAIYKQIVMSLIKEKFSHQVESGKVSQEYVDVLLECTEKHLSYTNYEMKKLFKIFSWDSSSGRHIELDKNWGKSAAAEHLFTKLQY